MFIETIARPAYKARSVNATTTVYPARGYTLTEPKGDSGDGIGQAIIELVEGGKLTQNSVILWPYSSGGNDSAFSVRVIGWKKVVTEWLPTTLCELACVAGAMNGIPGGQLGPTEFLADTISFTVSSILAGEAPRESGVSPNNDTPAHVLIDTKGCQKLELVFAGSGCNAFYSLV